MQATNCDGMIPVGYARDKGTESDKAQRRRERARKRENKKKEKRRKKKK